MSERPTQRSRVKDNVRRSTLLVVGTVVVLAAMKTALVTGPRYPEDVTRLATVGGFLFVIPFGVLAAHTLVHGGSLPRRLALGIATTSAAYVAYFFVSLLLLDW